MCDFLRKLFGGSSPTIERPSPKIRITPQLADDIIKAVQKIPGMENCFIAGIAPTNSMEPTLDDGMYIILQPVQFTDLIAGDIIMYETPYFNQGNPVLHRIIEIGFDTERYATAKGDNNAVADNVKISTDQVKGVWRITIA